MNLRFSFLLAGLMLSASPAPAQLVLPGAASSAPSGTPATTSKPKKASTSSRGETGAAEPKGTPIKIAPPGAASIDGQPLLLNGQTGLLQISGSGPNLQIDKLRLAGEGVSDPSQPCVVDIVGDKPIQATSAGSPDGLERFEADVPACPFSFDLLSGAVLVPSQITACVFKAADCQTSPGGLWGPDGAAIDKDAASIAKRRSLAEKAMAKTLRAIEDRAANNPDAANILRDQNGFPGERDEACRNYVKESSIGYCATSLTEARAALLQARLDALHPPSAAKPTAKAEKKKPAKKTPKPDAAAAQ